MAPFGEGTQKAWEEEKKIDALISLQCLLFDFTGCGGKKKVFARMQGSSYIKGRRKQKNLLTLPGREQIYCIQHKENLYTG